MLRDQLDDSGFNDLIGDFISGEIAHRDAVRSIELFAKQVMPATVERHSRDG